MAAQHPIIGIGPLNSLSSRLQTNWVVLPADMVLASSHNVRTRDGFAYKVQSDLIILQLNVAIKSTSGAPVQIQFQLPHGLEFAEFTTDDRVTPNGLSISLIGTDQVLVTRALGFSLKVL